MWNRRKEDEQIPKLAPQPPTNAALAREGIPLNTLPQRHEPEHARTASIGKSCQIKGQLYSREDLYIDGEIEGSVEMQEHRLTVGPNGQIRAGIKAREIVVQGTVHGNVEAGDRIEIRKEAKLVGDIKTARIVIEDGAYFKGSIDIVRTEAPKIQAPQRAAAAPVPAAAAAAASPPKV